MTLTHRTISSKNITLTQQPMKTPKIANEALKSISPTITDIKINKLSLRQVRVEKKKLCQYLKYTCVVYKVTQCPEQNKKLNSLNERLSLA